MTEGDSALTVKELVLRVEGTLNSFIQVHEVRHVAEQNALLNSQADPAGSPAGRALLQQLGDLANDITALTAIVTGHERTLQRLVGAVALLTFMGLGTLGLIGSRLLGILP